jgi:hypothetical protein
MSLPELKSETLLPFAQGWIAPTRAELRAVIDAAGLNPASCACLVGSSRKALNSWTTGAAPIPFACWALICLKAGYPVFWDEQ